MEYCGHCLYVLECGGDGFLIEVPEHDRLVDGAAGEHVLDALVPGQRQHGVLVPHPGDALLLPGLPAQGEGWLQAVDNVEVPDLDLRLHRAYRHQAPLRVRLRVERQPFCNRKGREGLSKRLAAPTNKFIFLILI